MQGIYTQPYVKIGAFCVLWLWAGWEHACIVCAGTHDTTQNYRIWSLLCIVIAGSLRAWMHGLGQPGQSHRCTAIRTIICSHRLSASSTVSETTKHISSVSSMGRVRLPNTHQASSRHLCSAEDVKLKNWQVSSAFKFLFVKPSICSITSCILYVLRKTKMTLYPRIRFLIPQQSSIVFVLLYGTCSMSCVT
jgi:hypothetical protein